MSFPHLSPVAVIATLLFTFACDNAPEPMSPSHEPSFAKGGNAKNQKANGHARVESPTSPGLVHEYTFNARAHKGEYSGQISGIFHTTVGDFTFGGDVTCLSVDPGTKHARVTGRVTRSSIPSFVGTNIIWTVTDNGQGAKAPPDAASTIFTTSTPQVQCATFGNFEVPSEDTEVKVIP
jgi:hypothetical protein